jgi:hypothetical protein
VPKRARGRPDGANRRRRASVTEVEDDGVGDEAGVLGSVQSVQAKQRSSAKLRDTPGRRAGHGGREVQPRPDMAALGLAGEERGEAGRGSGAARVRQGGQGGAQVGVRGGSGTRCRAEARGGRCARACERWVFDSGSGRSSRKG